MKVIFLDFDGVILTAESYKQRKACKGSRFSAAQDCVKNLNKLIEETGASIVVSSAWRIGETTKSLGDLLFTWGVRGKVIGKTPYFPEAIRGTEIKEWLINASSENEISAFVILDDDKDMGELLTHLVQTEFIEGFQELHYYRAKEMLERGIFYANATYQVQQSTSNP